ncbi:hypothetical protein BBO99_00005320 [Phytophthora kernoviae]|uniref:C2 domain-containing protein n=1 Tax=Phytophthora kernoviae TaxID=325452 RepID=A0A421F868_9STRA|nr:hypothetical protein BBI17_005478 [Phytophthora kernoviae]RLN79349.1 hypothetical protein BBO99_00005320 [Phytophthora kernoviae]
MRRTKSTSGSSVNSADDDSEDAPVDILPKEIRLAEDADDTLPNTLVITVLQARNLQPSTLRGTLSCYVKLVSLGSEFKTSVMTKTREPRWHEVFVFRAVDWTTGVTVSLRDRLPFKMHFLGQVVISSAEIASLPGMIAQRWFQLRDKGPAGTTTGAELELKVALVYTKANDPAFFETGTAAVELEHGAVDAGITDLLVGQEDETEEEAHTRTKAVLRREEQEREAAASIAALKQGDYQVQVHIIEARDLKGENLSGTSDPYCLVDIMGVSKRTSTKYETLGCVFDEILFFHFPNVGRHELQEASIKISVYDKERVLKDNLIGTYQLDCLSVYGQPSHELYRQWIAVHDNLNKKDRGIQGFLLVSVVVLGPGDALRVHDRDAEIEQELAEVPEANYPTTTPPLVLVPPTIELKLQFLVVKILQVLRAPGVEEHRNNKEDFVSVSFARFRAEDLFSGGFATKCQWVVLQEEIARRQTRHALEQSQNTGVLLLRLGFGRVEMATRHPWFDENNSDELFVPSRFPRVHREIRVHVFQARGLEPPAGVARMPNPAVNVRCCGQQKRTMVCQHTQAPLFYESLVFLTNVPAADVVFTPDIVVQVVDTAGNKGAAGVLGELGLSLAPPGILRPPASITPKYTDATLDIVALGIRRLKALSTLGVRRPHVEFELVGGYFVDGSSLKRTQPGLLTGAQGASSGGKNANFLDRIVAHVKLPLDNLYTPQLRIQVCDSMLGGLRKTVLASCVVDLANKLPWSSTYHVEAVEGVGPRFNNPSPRKKHGAQQQSSKEPGTNISGKYFSGDISKESDNHEDDENEYFFDEGQPEVEVDTPVDDGIGIGDLILPSVLHSHARLNDSNTSDDNDPALMEQRPVSKNNIEHPTFVDGTGGFLNTVEKN